MDFNALFIEPLEN